MERARIYKILNLYKKDLEDRGYHVIYIGLYGSQNYNVDDDLSDIDARAIVLPSLHDVIFRNSTSKTIEYETGAVDIKDLITYYEVIKKGNVSFIEPIDTDYYLGDKTIKEMFKVFRPNFKGIVGTMKEKRKVLNHPFPSKQEEFKKWGCDPKQYHHIVRLYDLIKYNLENNTSLSYLEYKDEKQKKMIELKRNTLNLSYQYMADDADRLISEAENLIKGISAYIINDVSEQISIYIEKYLKISLYRSNVSYAREYRTFDANIPSKDLEKFPELKKYNGKDISYIVYESIEII